ncbi:carbonic anhydrase 13-like isoform X2 [Planococcus citri]
MKFVFHYGLQNYIIFFLFLYCQRFVVFVQTNHAADDPHSIDGVHQSESHNEVFYDSESHTYPSASAYESNTHPISRNNHDEFPDSQTRQFHTDGFQTQETKNFISIISKSFLQRIPTTRIVYSKLNHTNYWPFNMERVRLPPGYQSPINIHTDRIDKISMPPLDTHSYEELDDSAELICFNAGHTIECKVKNGTNPPYIQGGPLPAKYIFDNMHWHWGSRSAGSEHLINGIPYAAEVHVVHYKEKYGSFEMARKKQDGLAIFALFGRITSDDNDDLEIHFNDILHHLIVPAKTHVTKWQDVFKFIHKIVLNNQQWMTYPGSLTSAPYKESVTWLVYFQCFDISSNQLDVLRSTLRSKGGKNLDHRRPVYDIRGDNRPMLVQ